MSKVKHEFILSGITTNPNSEGEVSYYGYRIDQQGERLDDNIYYFKGKPIEVWERGVMVVRFFDLNRDYSSREVIKHRGMDGNFYIRLNGAQIKESFPVNPWTVDHHSLIQSTARNLALVYAAVEGDTAKFESAVKMIYNKAVETSGSILKISSRNLLE